MPHPVFAASNVALITGAASGIGLAIARICASHNLKLLLTDINGPLLEEAGKSLNIPSENLETIAMDVGDRNAWRSVKQKVDGKFGGKVDFLVLNAGVGPKTAWEDVESFQKVCTSWLVSTQKMDANEGSCLPRTFLVSLTVSRSSCPC